MEYCYRYWAWTKDICTNEVGFMKDLALWNCLVERNGEFVNIWVPEQAELLLRLKYPSLCRHPVFDRH